MSIYGTRQQFTELVESRDEWVPVHQLIQIRMFEYNAITLPRPNCSVQCISLKRVGVKFPCQSWWKELLEVPIVISSKSRFWLVGTMLCCCLLCYNLAHTSETTVVTDESDIASVNSHWTSSCTEHFFSVRKIGTITWCALMNQRARKSSSCWTLPS